MFTQTGAIHDTYVDKYSNRKRGLNIYICDKINNIINLLKLA